MLGSLAMRTATVVSAGRTTTRARRQREALELSEQEALLRRRRTMCDCTDWLQKPLLYFSRARWWCEIFGAPTECGHVS